MSRRRYFWVKVAAMKQHFGLIKAASVGTACAQLVGLPAPSMTIGGVVAGTSNSVVKGRAGDRERAQTMLKADLSRIYPG